MNILKKFPKFCQTCTHQKKRLDKRTWIPALFMQRFMTISEDADVDFPNETATTTEQQLPKILERRRPIEKLRVLGFTRNGDALLAVRFECQYFYYITIYYLVILNSNFLKFQLFINNRAN